MTYNLTKNIYVYRKKGLYVFRTYKWFNIDNVICTGIFSKTRMRTVNVFGRNVVAQLDCKNPVFY